MRKGLPGGHPFNTYISWGLDVVFVLHRHVVRDGFQASASTAHSPLVAVAGGGSWVTSRRNHSVGVERMEELGFHSRIETTRMHQAAECMCAESKPLPRDGRQAPGKLSRCSHHDLCSRLDIYFPLCRLWPPSTGPHPEAACPLQESVDGQSWRWEESGKRPKPMGKPIPGRPGVVKDAASTIYAKNLPYAATEADLEAFFSRAGEIVDIRRPGDDKGRPTGHCFIQYSSPTEAEAALQFNEQVLMGRPITIAMSTPQSAGAHQEPTGKPVESCWFCLSNPNAAIWLVVSVGQETYLTLDKSPMHPQHVLLIPIEHYPSAVSLSPSARAEAAAYISSVRKFYQSQGCETVGFERYMRLRRMGGNHCHINLVPISRKAADSARSTFEQLAQQEGFSFYHIPTDSLDKIAEVVGDDEYFTAYLPDGSVLVTQIVRDQKHPMDFGRRALAELIGCPDKAHPKACQMSQGEEEELATKFKEGFKAFDVAL